MDLTLFGGYYLSADFPMWNIKWLHSTHCGMWDNKHLQYIKSYKEEIEDTKGEFQEMFDMSLGVADQVATMLHTDPQALLTTLTPYALAAVQADMQAGYSLKEILERNIAIMVPEYVGPTWADAVQWLGIVPSVNEDGVECWPADRCSQELPV